MANKGKSGLTSLGAVMVQAGLKTASSDTNSKWEVKLTPEQRQFPIDQVTFNLDNEHQVIMLVPKQWNDFAQYMNQHSDMRVTVGPGNKSYAMWVDTSDGDDEIEVLDWFARQNNFDRYSHLIIHYRDRILENRKAMEKARIEIMETGKIRFNQIRILLHRDQSVVVDTAYDIIRGGIINAFRMDEYYGMRWLTIFVRGLEYNNGKFVLADNQFRINEFPGSMNISDLPVRPLNPEDTKILSARADKFKDFVKSPHYLFYSGNMFRRSWFFTNKYRADGRVIVDEMSFAKFNPNYNRSNGSEVDEMTDKVLMTASPVVKGYSMRLKMWGELALDNLKSIDFKDDAFDLLVMNHDKKALVHALVSSTSNFNDLIGGKGGGTIFLLHGGPGTGKTLTAEAVSEILHRPLYMVSVGELGTTANELEGRLRDILELATIWNAVLLIDEADIFLEERTTNNIERNAMVGIFLRLLEYYAGTLFLTTNRIKVIDPAFMSRISIALHYEKLEEKARQQIWKVLLGAQGITFSDADLKTLAVHVLNGRQIKNIIKMGLTLADNKKIPLDMNVVDFIIDQMSTDTDD